jgi:hypothetical protein
VILCAITAVIRKYSIAEFIFILAWFLLLGIAPHFLYQDIPIIPFVLFILFFTFLYLLFSWEMNRSEIIEVRGDDSASLKSIQKLIIELEDWLSDKEIKFRKEENELTIEIGEKKWIWITLSNESTETLRKYIIELKTHRTKESAEYDKIKGFIINSIKNS